MKPPPERLAAGNPEPESVNVSRPTRRLHSGSSRRLQKKAKKSLEEFRNPCTQPPVHIVDDEENRSKKRKKIVGAVQTCDTKADFDTLLLHVVR